MEEIFVPTLHTFAMNNGFTGSQGLFRYKITPVVVMKTPKEVDMEQSSIRAEYWYGPFCYEKSQIEEEKTFAMSAEGRQAMQDWLCAHRQVEEE